MTDDEVFEEKSVEEMVREPVVYGLHNIGNTCWLNSLLQCLLNIDIFFDMVKKIEVNDSGDSLISLFVRLKQNVKDMSATSSILNCILNKVRSNFSYGVPQDSQEAFLYFIDILQNETSKPVSVDSSARPHIKEWFKFQGYKESIIYDLFHTQFYFRTSDKEDRFEPILTFPLFYEDSFQDSFDSIFKDKSITILSPIITIHVVNSKYINEFDLLEYFELECIMNNKVVTSRYYLSSCIFHIGSEFNGHYISVVKKNGRYFLCDDVNITEMRNGDIFRRLIPTLLFYTAVQEK
ncbi:hypothetical protein EBU71_12090 [bacterium]|nr:hypothetical protein [Candidatus Elulimicrobium humile]